MDPTVKGPLLNMVALHSMSPYRAWLLVSQVFAFGRHLTTHSYKKTLLEELAAIMFVQRAIDFFLDIQAQKDLIYKFKSIGNYVCKNNLSSYFLALFSHSLSTVIPLIYNKVIFVSMFIDGYYKDIFSQKKLLQFIDKNILSVCLFVFVNFIVVICIYCLQQ